MLRKFTFPIAIIFIFSALIAFPTQASTPNRDSPTYQPANYCVSCHSSGDPRLENATAWNGGIEHNPINPCPAMIEITEELYYTERLMLAIDRAQAQAPANADLSRSDSRLHAAQQNYSRLLDSPVTSLEAFTSEAKMVRFQLGKSYSAISQAIETAKRVNVLWAAVGVSLLIVVSLIWGYVNAQKALRTPHPAPKRVYSFYFSRAVILIFIFLLFALPIFRLPSQAVEMPSDEEQERQAVLDDTRRAALTADRELSRAWMLAQIGATWAQKDPTRGDVILKESLTAAQEAQTNASALWGFSQEAWEAGGVEYATQAKAALVASDLDSVRGRAWGLRLIAETWMEIDPERAETILSEAVALTENAIYPYQQLDLRAIALTWAKLDPEKGATIAWRISDPALQSWAFREIAAITGENGYFESAVAAAHRMADPVQQARALREIGVGSGAPALFSEAFEILNEVEGGALAFALADLAVSASDPSFAAEISSEYPAAQALAYLGLGDVEKAWDAAARIADPFEQARAQAAIAKVWENASAAAQITYPLLRDRALRDISLNTGDPALVPEIQDSYYQIQVLTAAGQYGAAWDAAEDLKDGYPLVDLGIAWVESDSEAAAQLVLALTREADKTAVLRAVAAATGDPTDFESALGMALATRVRGDALSPVQASLDLAKAFESSPALFEAAMAQAYDAAQKINIIY